MFRRRKRTDDEEIEALIAAQLSSPTFLSDRLGMSFELGSQLVCEHNAETTAAGVAGRIGECVGFTEPEKGSGITDIVGGTDDGVAIALEFADGTMIWINPTFLAPSEMG